MKNTRQLGFLSSLGLVIVGMTYAIVVGFGIAQVGLDKPIIDPTLAVMEAITLVSAPLIVILLAAVSGLASPERKVFGVLALTFGAIMAGLTSAVHFVTLTAGRQMNFTTLDWPSTLYSVELLAWDVFLGLALVFAAPAVTGRGHSARARWALFATGVLCLLGAIGPMVGNMAIQRVGILGYGIVLPISCIFLALVFHEGKGHEKAETL
ncbi:MAG: hypothetical protein IPJ86_15560 [Bacteroidetes bacterium]|jgi:hypothetical protein|nr:hypothetical protein [Bacteroidota bacterium]MBL0095905.1 hypothetical protein [Bacteroidota bacterium]